MPRPTYSTASRDRYRTAVTVGTGLGVVGALAGSGWLAGAAAARFEAEELSRPGGPAGRRSADADRATRRPAPARAADQDPGHRPLRLRGRRHHRRRGRHGHARRQRLLRVGGSGGQGAPAARAAAVRRPDPVPRRPRHPSRRRRRAAHERAATVPRVRHDRLRHRAGGARPRSRRSRRPDAWWPTWTRRAAASVSTPTWRG